MDKKHYCYILTTDYEDHTNYTYNGYTNNPERRLRQHNGEIKGGAKYTKMYGKSQWKYLVLIEGYPNMENALQCEWRIKHPEGKKRSRKWTGPKGRLLSLNEILKLEKWTSKSVINNSDIKLKINILEEYKDIINTDDLPENIEIIYIN